MSVSEEHVEPTEAEHARDHQHLRRNYNYALCTSVVLAVVGLVTTVAASRLYGASVIGQFALISSPYLLVLGLSNMNEHAALVRRLALLPPKTPAGTGLSLATFLFSFVLTTVVAAVVFSLTTLVLAGPIGDKGLVLPALIVVVAYVLFMNTSWNIDHVLIAFRAGRDLFLARLPQPLVTMVAVVALHPFGASYWSLVVATVAGFVVGLVARLVVVRRYVTRRVSGEHFRSGLREMPSMLNFALRAWPGMLASGLVWQLGLWIVGARLGVAEAGVWARAAGLAERVQDVGYRFQDALYPALVRHDQRSKDDRVFTRAYWQVVVPGGITVLLGVAVASGAASGIMALFGPEFVAGADVLRGLLAYGLLATLLWSTTTVFLARGRPGRVTIWSALRAAATVVLMLSLEPAFGSTGVAVALAMGAALELVARWVDLGRLRLIGAPVGSRPLLVRAAIGAVVGFAAAALGASLVDGGLGALCGVLLGGACVCLVMAAGGSREARRRRFAQLRGHP